MKQYYPLPKVTKLVRSQIEIIAERGKVPLASLVKRKPLPERAYHALGTDRVETALDWNERMRRTHSRLKPIASLRGV